MNYIYILLTIIFTVYGQLVIKWQVSNAGDLPLTFASKLLFLINMFLNPWIISAFVAAFLAALSWMAAMTKFELSHAYPFMSLAFVLVLIFSVALFSEAITWPKIVGLSVIIIGICISSQS